MLRAKTSQTVFAFAVAALTLSGCFGESKATIAGKVTIDGQPVANGAIRFAPVDGVGPTDGATIDQGLYSTEMFTGAKSVRIEAHKKVGEAPHDPSDPSSPILPVYEPITTYETAADVTASTSDLDFDIPAPASP